MRDDDPEARPKKPVAHEIGADLSAVSEAELAERIELLRAEIVRLEDAARRKAESRTIAGTFFR